MLRGQLNLFLSNSRLLREAADVLLDDNLVWSDDFDGVRAILSRWLREEARKGNHASESSLAFAKEIVGGF